MICLQSLDPIASGVTDKKEVPFGSWLPKWSLDITFPPRDIFSPKCLCGTLRNSCNVGATYIPEVRVPAEVMAGLESILELHFPTYGL